LYDVVSDTDLSNKIDRILSPTTLDNLFDL
jgi:hypothetical protein